jgi:hypothetical protein
MLSNKKKLSTLILLICVGSFPLAQANVCPDSQFNTCGVEFTVIPDVSNLTLATCTNSITETYTIKNFLPFSVPLGPPEIIQEDNLSTDSVTIASTTCTTNLAAGASCNINLKFALCETGTINRELKIPVMTSQGSVSTDITIDVLAAIASFAYITNQTDASKQIGSVSVCDIEENGELTTCQNAGQTFDSPAGMNIPSMIFSSAYTYAYIANTAGNNISLCTINNVTGLFTNCDNTGPSFTNPFGITSTLGINASTYYAYITDEPATPPAAVNTNVNQCTINPTTGVLDDCSSALILPAAPGENGITAQTVNGTDYTYVTNGAAGTITVCVNNATEGNLQNCFDSGVGALFTDPWNISFYNTTDNLYAYIADLDYQTQGAIWQCTVNSINGALFNCESNTTFVAPSDINFFNIGSAPYAWITNNDDNSLIVCSVNSDGSLTCPNGYVSLNSIQQSNAPGGIAAQSFAGTDYIYVVLTGSNDIQQCKVGTSGLVYCISALTNVSSNPFAQPNNIAFNLNDNGNVYAYVTDANVGEIYYCSIDQTSGQFEDCYLAGPEGLNAPLGLAFANVNGTTYAYITDTNYETIFQCEVQQPVTPPNPQPHPVASLCNCTDAGIDIVPPYTHPVASANFNAAYVYVADALQNLIYQCELDNSTGLFTSCVDAGSPSSFFHNPVTIDFSVVDSTTYAYVTNGGNNTVTQCTVNPVTGKFSSVCQINPADATPNGITFTQMLSNTYAYVTFPNESTEPNLQLCIVSSNGALADCQNALGEPTSVTLVNQAIVGAIASALVTEVGGSGILTCEIAGTNPGQIGPCTDAGTEFLFLAPQTLVVQTFNDVSYAYIVDSELQTVTQYDVTTTATLDNRQVSGAGTLDFVPTSITFSTIDDKIYAYINDNENLYTTQCLVTPGNTPPFSDCVTTGLPIFTQPLGISFYDYAYIPDAATGLLAVCSPLENGLLQVCKDSGVGDYFNQPSAVALNINADDELLAYIADASTNAVVACTVEQITGLFSSCVDSGSTFEQPAGITFNNSTGTTYAYVTNSSSGAVSQCALNPDGTFSTCLPEEAGSFSTPISIQFLAP